MINHTWRGLKEKMGWSEGGRLAKLSAGALTFLAVVVGWVFFRSDSFSSAITMLHGMAGLNGVSLEGKITHEWIIFTGRVEKLKLGVFIIGFAITWGLPNLREVFSPYSPTCDIDNHENNTFTSIFLSKFGLDFQWKRSLAWMLGTATLAAVTLAMMGSHSEFLYFQF